ncbi:GDPGTP exchange factor Sec2p [Metarhizium album ARSEF 1941]|uniref:GDPGTP exchange factor Sec2p n=1 Tax=Metarhizium album (strain ARSEF 1941) TaxID=1081103 RepID=A0A0B2WQA9_METAS|nr:GDPGTP exchange factor Sec2p [Metarhizium album ARSEF 1941]KHN95804.1 GDPGTP exchange factor Sec2p [Metarhizium album ARSEF 1941]
MTAKTTLNTPATPSATPSCPSCGFALSPSPSPQADLLLARQKIAQLESIITDLNAKASDAVRRCAKYDEELHALRAQHRPSTPSQSQPDAPSTSSPSSIASRQSPTLPYRLSALLYPRKSSLPLRLAPGLAPPLPPLSPATTIPSTEHLMEALTREQALRREAEGRLSATSKEVEELSVSLFEQANEMVASERRARALLEERVDELEKRDGEKRRRLERLEAAMARIQRVRNLLDG